MKLQILFYFLFVLFLSGSVFAEVEEDSESLRAMRDSLNLELDIISECFQLEPGFVKQLRQELEEEVKAAAVRYDDEIDERLGFGTDLELDSELADALHQLLGDRLPETQLELHRQYVADAKKLRRHWQRMGQESIVVFLNQFISLTRKQESEVLEILEANWHSSWNEGALELSLDVATEIDPVIEMLIDKGLMELLSDSQREVIEDLSEIRVALSELCYGTIDFDKLADTANRLMILRVEQIVATHGLNDGQRRMLNVGRKGAVSKTMERLQNLNEKFEDEESKFMSIEYLKVVYRPLVSNCDQQPEWGRVLTKVLTPEQHTDFLEQENERSRMKCEQNFGYVVRSLAATGEVKLSYKQVKSMIDLLNEEVAHSEAENFVTSLVGFHQIDEAKLEPIFYDQQWAKIQPNLEDERQYILELAESDEEDDSEIE